MLPETLELNFWLSEELLVLHNVRLLCRQIYQKNLLTVRENKDINKDILCSIYFYYFYVHRNLQYLSSLKHIWLWKIKTGTTVKKSNKRNSDASLHHAATLPRKQQRHPKCPHVLSKWRKYTYTSYTNWRLLKLYVRAIQLCDIGSTVVSKGTFNTIIACSHKIHTILIQLSHR